MLMNVWLAHPAVGCRIMDLGAAHSSSATEEGLVWGQQLGPLVWGSLRGSSLHALQVCPCLELPTWGA